jgi:hypothetical protein
MRPAHRHFRIAPASPWYRRLALTLLTLLAFGCHQQVPTTPTSVVVEVFLVTFEAETVQYQRLVRELGAPANDPDAAVRLALDKVPAGQRTSLYHSTSWHFQPPNQVVLTYLACTQGVLDPKSARRIPIGDLPGVAPVDPKKPRPDNLDELQVLSHGLRHLAYLLRRDSEPRLRVAVGPIGERILSKLTPELAGELRN